MKVHVLLMTFFFMSVESQVPHTIQKIFAHVTGQKADTIEMGNIIFSMDVDQHVDILKTVVEGDFERRTYFLPMAKLSPEIKLKEIMHDLKAIPSHMCSVTITEEVKPIVGVKVEFRYNTKLVDIMYDTFSAITLKKGIIFRIYNRVILNKLQHIQDDQSLLTVASHAGVPTVVIDCGHGGEDDGAIGVGNIKEKDINLNIGLLVAQQLKKKGVNALLTRTTDTTVPLKERIVFANKAKADLFISIHSNAALNQNASGIETFSVVPLLAMLSSTALNDTAEKNELISQRLVKYRVAQSMDCARVIHNALISYIKDINYNVKDRTVKKAPLLVLLGTTMPAVLVEVGFVSNPQEALLLADAVYQSYLAHGITDGVLHYLQRAS